jgi:hypothetical protein
MTERRIARAWRWVKHRLGIDNWTERREKERRAKLERISHDKRCD